MAFTYITVTGTRVMPDGTPAAGSYSFTPTATMRNGVTTVAGPILGNLVAGELSVDLAATTDPATTPTGVTYLVKEYVTGLNTRSYYLTVPHDGGDLDLDTAEIVESYPTPVQTVGYSDEQVRDVMGTALVAGSNVTITPNDGANTITIAATGGGGGSGGVPDDGSVTNAKVASNAAINADKLADGTTKKVMTAAERTKLAAIADGATAYTDEQARDAVGAALVAGTDVSVTVNDGSDTITVASTAPFKSTNTDLTGAQVGAVLAVTDDDPVSTALVVPADLASMKAAFGSTRRLPLFGFDVALANRATTPVDVLALGDSVMEGEGVLDGLQNAWPDQLVAGLRALYPTNGVLGSGTDTGAGGTNNGGLPGGGAGYVARAAVSGTGGFRPATTGTVTSGTRGLGHRSSILGTGATWSAVRGLSTSVGVLLYRSGTDAMTIAIDGVTAATLTAGPTGYVWWTSAALTHGKHTVLVTQTAGAPEVCGVMFYDGDEAKGIRYWNGAKSGAKAADLATVSGGSQEWATAADTIGMAPELILLGFLLNDALAVDAATYKTHMQALITLCRSKWPNTPIVLVGTYRRPSTAPVDAGGWPAYYQAQRELVAANAAMLHVNLDDRMPSLTTDTYGFLADGTHPSTRGARWIANTVLGAIASTAPAQPAPALEGATLGSPRVVAGSTTTALTLDGDAGLNVDQALTRGGVLRWIWRMANDTESGGNNGSALQLSARTDAGANIGTVLQVIRSSRVVQFLNGLKLPGFTTAGRVSAATVGAGGVYYDSTLGVPVYSDGTNWKRFDTNANV